MKKPETQTDEWQRLFLTAANHSESLGYISNRVTSYCLISGKSLEGHFHSESHLPENDNTLLSSSTFLSSLSAFIKKKKKKLKRAVVFFFFKGLSSYVGCLLLAQQKRIVVSLQPPHHRLLKQSLCGLTGLHNVCCLYFQEQMSVNSFWWKTASSLNIRAVVYQKKLQLRTFGHKTY